ncbi:hypothetical protein COT97_05370 [Candidatus Falkowbacteria bacterium CG10_big_fil_rev_8_21_14_0_10_39_11]|uniref:Uncharacterized protein n=1 Tax=Candidatus Falkowbacteria bacterium CG10_big_fil_rev_8_21_14_0_10_39_11 TaxID=1974565 RepID=A0A2H0V3M0_9BACT|nr:MAG: hypothetical protein COT97_05370 [Candidatus Falkowbacteria bacterium CG10_big_fil_rev_8_21_14_0_10_39_11]
MILSPEDLHAMIEILYNCKSDQAILANLGAAHLGAIVTIVVIDREKQRPVLEQVRIAARMQNSQQVLIDSRRSGLCDRPIEYPCLMTA